MNLQPKKIFISYAHANEEYFQVFTDRFYSALKTSKRYKWEIWDDRQILLGKDWHDQIQNALTQSDLGIFLLSIDFFTSEYIEEKEWKKLDGLKIPVKFMPCDMNTWTSLSKIQVWMPKGKSYVCAHISDFSFSHLIKFNPNTGLPFPNPYVDSYMLDLVQQIELSLQSDKTTIQNTKENEKLRDLRNEFRKKYKRITGIDLPQDFDLDRVNAELLTRIKHQK